MHARSECSTGCKFCRPIQQCRLCLFSLSPPFIPLLSFYPSPLPFFLHLFSPLSVSALSLFLCPLVSWRPCLISFIPGHLSFNNSHSKLTFVRMIRDTMPDDGISTIKGLQTALTLAILVADVL